MIDRYRYLEGLYLRNPSASEQRLSDSRADWGVPRNRHAYAHFIVPRKATRAKRVHHSRTQTGSSSEILLLTLGMLSGLGALALAAYQLAS